MAKKVKELKLTDSVLTEAEVSEAINQAVSGVVTEEEIADSVTTNTLKSSSLCTNIIYTNFVCAEGWVTAKSGGVSVGCYGSGPNMGSARIDIHPTYMAYEAGGGTTAYQYERYSFQTNDKDQILRRSDLDSITIEGSGGGVSVEDFARLQEDVDNKAALCHTHAMSDVSGLTDCLGGKALGAHTHSISDVSGLYDCLTTKLSGSELTDLVTKVDGKAAKAHTHVISDVDELSDVLAGKAEAVHTHSATDINGLSVCLAAMRNDITNFQCQTVQNWVAMCDALTTCVNENTQVIATLCGRLDTVDECISENAEAISTLCSSYDSLYSCYTSVCDAINTLSSCVNDCFYTKTEIDNMLEDDGWGSDDDSSVDTSALAQFVQTLCGKIDNVCTSVDSLCSDMASVCELAYYTRRDLNCTKECLVEFSETIGCEVCWLLCTVGDDETASMTSVSASPSEAIDTTASYTKNPQGFALTLAHLGFDANTSIVPKTLNFYSTGNTTADWATSSFYVHIRRYCSFTDSWFVAYRSTNSVTPATYAAGEAWGAWQLEPYSDDTADAIPTGEIIEIDPVKENDIGADGFYSVNVLHRASTETGVYRINGSNHGTISAIQSNSEYVPHVDMTGCATQTVLSRLSALESGGTGNVYTKDEIDSKLDDLVLGDLEVDLTSYVKTEDLETRLEELGAGDVNFHAYDCYYGLVDADDNCLKIYACGAQPGAYCVARVSYGITGSGVCTWDFTTQDYVDYHTGITSAEYPSSSPCACVLVCYELHLTGDGTRHASIYVNSDGADSPTYSAELFLRTSGGCVFNGTLITSSNFCSYLAANVATQEELEAVQTALTTLDNCVINNYMTKASLDGYATEALLEACYVDTEDIEAYAKKTDLEGYAKKTDLEIYDAALDELVDLQDRVALLESTDATLSTIADELEAL